MSYYLISYESVRVGSGGCSRIVRAACIDRTVANIPTKQVYMADETGQLGVPAYTSPRTKLMITPPASINTMYGETLDAIEHKHIAGLITWLASFGYTLQDLRMVAFPEVTGFYIL